MSKWRSFSQGYLLGQRMVEDYDRAKKKRELEEIATAKPEFMQVFTTEDADQLRAAADSGQYDIGIKTDERGEFKGYTVTPKADPSQTGTIGMQGVTDFLGTRTAGRMSQDQQDRARQMAMAGVLEKYDPQEGMRLRREIKAQERDDARWDRQTKEWERQDQDRAREEQYLAERERLLQESPVTQYQAITGKYERDMAAYNEALKSGKTPEEIGPPPEKPNVQRPGPLQTLAGYARLIQHDYKYGKLNTEGLISFQDKYNRAEQENYVRALQVAQSGGTPEQVAKMFNAAGMQIDPRNVTISRTKQANGPDQVTLSYVDGNGRTASVNVLAELTAYGEAKQVYDLFFAGESNRRADTQLQLNVNADRRAATRQADEAQAREASYNLWLEQNPNATEAQKAAARAQILKPTVPGNVDDKAPSEVRLAQALVNAGVEPDMAAALRRAMSSKEKSPAVIRAEIYGKALTANFGNAEAARKATEEAMKYLFPDGGAPAKPAQGGSREATGRAVNGSPYPEGTRLRGKDGKMYVVRNGVPVPE